MAKSKMDKLLVGGLVAAGVGSVIYLLFKPGKAKALGPGYAATTINAEDAGVHIATKLLTEHPMNDAPANMMPLLYESLPGLIGKGKPIRYFTDDKTYIIGFDTGQWVLLAPIAEI